MRLLKLSLFLGFLVLSGFYSTAQNGELGQSDCSYAKEVIIPFNYNTTEKLLLNQRVFYSFRDQFTFWYKVVVKKNMPLKFSVKPLNDSDAYSVIVYNYGQPDFCNKVFFQKIKPVKTNFFIGKGSLQVRNENEKEFLALEGNTYYIGVLNTSLNNCGHRFYLSYAGDTLKVDAIHLPCKRDVTSLSVKTVKPATKPVEPEVKIQPVKKDTIIAEVKVPKRDTIKQETKISVNETTVPKTYPLEIITLHIKNKKPVDAKLSLFEKQGGQPVDVITKQKGSCVAELDREKAYVAKATAFGYKNSELVINTPELVAQNKTKAELLMEPLKVGDSFIMKSIYFVPNTYALRKESLVELEKLMTFLKSNENIFIEIQGHTNGDNRIYKNPSYTTLGEEWNFTGTSKKLSQKRAEVIRDYLVNNGITSERLIAKGYGGQKMIIKDPETNEEGQQNIRVEIYVLKN